MPHCTTSGEGPPLLLLHGLFDTLETWEKLIPHLSPRFKVYAIDLPGFGKTPLPDDWQESLSSMVKVVIGFLDQQGIAKISLVGSSMGGGLSLAVAQSDPARIDRIALLNPYGLPEIPLAVKNARHPIMGRLLPYLLRKNAMRKCASGIFKRSLYDESLLSQEDIERVAAPFSTLIQRKNLFRFLRAISPEKIKEIDALLPQIKQRVLILWGKEDGWLSDAHWKRLHEGLPESKVISIDSCGHLPQIEKPGEVSEALTAFF